jgi:hypothetical protein
MQTVQQPASLDQAFVGLDTATVWGKGRRLMPGRKSELEDLFALQLKAAGIPEPERNYRFHDKRKWELDFAWTEEDIKVTTGEIVHDPFIAIEIQGGTHIRGAHVRPSQYEKDREKINEATWLGWRVYEVTAAMVKDGRALALVEREFGKSGS